MLILDKAYFFTISKADLEFKQVRNFTIDIFIDDSGSTCSQLVSVRKNVLQAELIICQATKFDHIVLYNSTAKLCANIESAKPEGDTGPTVIFQSQ